MIPWPRISGLDRIGIDGEAEYRSQINNIIQQQKTLNAEMQKATSVFDKDTSAKQKNAKQLEILTKQTETQRAKVDQLRAMYEKSAAKTGESSTATLKWKEALTAAETELGRLESELSKASGAKTFTEQLEEASKKLEDIGSKMTEVGGSLTKSVTAPIAAIGAAGIAAFKDVDKGLDTIATKTGLAGEELNAMGDIMNDLATSMPTTFEDAGTAIGEINTRFGLTGDELESLSGQFLKFANINNTDVNGAIDKTQKLMAAFGVDASDAGAVLDLLNTVGQKTGISMDTLSSSLVTNGSAFRELGLSLADSANLMGTLEKSGVDASQVLSGLAKAQANAAKNGTSMNDALTQAFSSSGDAVEVFGAKAGPRLYEAFQSGIISVDMFTGSAASLDDTLGSVTTTFETTLDPIDQWQTTLNSAKLAGAELGNSMMTVAAPGLEKVAEWAKQAAEWFSGLDDDTKNTIVTIAGLAAAIGPVLTIGGKLISTVGKITSVFNTVSTAVSAAGGVIGFLSSPIGIAVAAIGGIIAVGITLYRNWDTIKAKAGEIATTISSKFNTIKTNISNAINGARDTVSRAIDRIKSIMNFSWSLPSLKLPHFHISGGFSLVPPSTPHISVDWYKKAYSNAVAFTSPTVLNTSSGLKGFGDGSGAEIVIGQNKLLDTFTAAVKRANGGGNTINVVVNPSAGMDEEDLAELVAEKIQAAIQTEREVFA